ncbi:MAG TPA: NAD(P)-dependent oxidoreductase [Bryobacteraceae bacterium]|nr:NAD(P)-dependent oxidoreductase [Bryobacteraceae bacterium]
MSGPVAGVLGLGIMGGEFAGHLAAAGVRTLGFDVLDDKRNALTARGGETCPSPAAVAAEADIILTSLPSASALEAALFGDRGVVSSGRRGILVVETSTLSLEAKESARLRLGEAGIAMMDAPVSGTGSQAASKDITVLASGDRADYDRAEVLLKHLASSVHYVGAFGAGSKMKYVANLLVTIHTLAAAEAIALAEKAGLDSKLVVELLARSGAGSTMLQVRGPSMAAGTYRTPLMKVGVFQKDLDIIASFARETGCAVPLFSASVPYFTAAQAQGMAGYDIGAVVEILRELAGLPAC